MRQLLKEHGAIVSYHGLAFTWSDDAEMWEMASEKTGRILAFLDDDELDELIDTLEV